MASRQSRSYSNPWYAGQLERYAPEQAYRNAVKDVNHRVVQYVQQAYRSDPRFLTNHADIDRLTALIAPAVQAGQLQIADLTNAHLSSLFGVEHPPAPDLSSFERQGVSRTTELARPFWTAIKAAEQGKDFDAAMAAGEHRLSKMVETDLQMAKVRQSREVLKTGGIQRYARVTGGNACWLCEIAATQVYYTEDLLPIHPSCVVSGTLVAVPSDEAGSASLLGSIEAATRQKFVGEIVELSTASGNLVRVTPNHPVLTDKGWIPAGLIRKGDNVFRSLRGERPVDGRPDVAQRPSRIEDVFAAASVTGRLLRVPTTAEDFHGDGSDSEVDVVWTASDLALPLDVLSVQQPGELCLMHAHGLGVPLVGQGAFDGLVGTRFAASRSNIRGGGDRGALLDGGAFVSQSGGSLRSARFNPTAAQFSGDGIASYAEQGRALIDRLAGKVERDSVIECRRVSFAGHVFNLQTAEGWYVADNIVLSNCNCSVAPIPDGGEAEIRKGFTPEEILKHSDEQVRKMLGLVEGGAPLKDYQDLVAVREHGEIGPMLTWEHQSFTGPNDLPVPVGLPGKASAVKELEWTGPKVVEPAQGLFGQSVDAEWQGANSFDAVKGDMRHGAQVAQAKGYTGIDAKTAKDWEYGLPKVPSKANVDNTSELLGQEIVSRAIHSDPTEAEFYRGMQMKPADAKKFKAGQEISMPLSSFTGSDSEATRWAKGETGWKSRDVPTGKVEPVLFELQPGAKLAPVFGEHVGFGQFEVVKVIPPHKVGIRMEPKLVVIRQTSMIEDGVAQGKSLPGASKTKAPKKIPEITFVKQWEQPDPFPKLPEPPKPVHINGVGYALEGTGIDPDLAAKFQGAVQDMKVKYPQSKLSAVLMSNTPGGAPAATFPNGGGPGGYLSGETHIRVNKAEMGAKTGKTSWYEWMNQELKINPRTVAHHSNNDVAYELGLHEFGHTLAFTGGNRDIVIKEVDPTLRKLYRDLHPGMTKVDVKEYNAWKRKQLSGYSFQEGSWAKLNKDEALAEAFASVESNPKKATEAEHALHDLLVKNSLRPQVTAKALLERDFSGVPAKVVEAKEKTRGEKYLAKYQQKATKYAKDVEAQAKREARAAAKVEKDAKAAAEKATKDAARQAKRDALNLKTFGTTDPETVAKIKAEMATMKAERRAILDDEKAKGFGSVMKRMTEGFEIKPVLTDGKYDIAATFAKYSGGKYREQLKENWRLAIKNTHMWAMEAGKAWYPELHRLTVRLTDMYGDTFKAAFGKDLTPDLVSSFMAAFSENNKWANNLVGVRKFLDGTGKMPQHRNLIGLTVQELMAGPDARKFTIADYDYDKRKVAGLQYDPKTGKITTNSQMYRWLSDLPPQAAITEAKPLAAQVKGEYVGNNYDFHVDKALRAIKNPDGGVADLRQNASGAPKPADFAANAAGDYTRGTADRWVSRIMLHTDDSAFAEQLRSYAITTDGVRDPVGYKLMSRVLEEVAAEFPGLTVAAAQAGPWIEVVGPSGSVAYIEDLTSIESVNRETLRRVKEFGEVG